MAGFRNVRTVWPNTAGPINLDARVLKSVFSGSGIFIKVHWIATVQSDTTKRC